MEKFVESLIALTNENKLIWHFHNFGQREDAGLAYLSPWMFCFQSERNRLVLQIAKSYHDWTELSGPECSLGPLFKAIVIQNSRAERGLVAKPAVDPKKLNKFQRDKMLKEDREERFRSRILGECERAIGNFKNQTAV